MKTKLLKLALCAMALMPMGAWAIDFGTEEVVSTTTTWTFNEYATGDYKSSNTAWNVVDKLYARSINTREFNIKELGAATTLTFSDGYVVNIAKVANSAKGYNNNNLTTLTAGATGNNYCTPFFAFNASVAGTCYVIVKGASGHKSRVYFTNGSSAKYSEAASTDVEELKYTSTEAGVFFIGAVGGTIDRDIYAIRFVPTSEKMDEWIYIRATGYATWGNTSGKDIESLPDGLTAYKATAASDGHSVTLTSLDKMRRGQGYVIKGTPNTNYGLTYGGTSVPDTYNGGDMVRVGADMDNFAPTADGKNRYILGDDGGTAKFFTPSGTGTLKKGKAYLQTTRTLTPVAGARGLDIIIEDETTAINAVATKSVNDGKYYNLQGIEVAHPTKGLYIVNGKKVFIK